MTPRTSTDSPLQIDTIIFGERGGALGMTLCPGKQGPSEYGGPWQRDINADIEVVRDWGCKILLTLMEDNELDMFNVRNIGDVTEKFGIVWRKIPIQDGNIPDERFDAIWPTVGRELVSMLYAGNRVVIHCRGGLGRTGTVACLLLIELGRLPDEALSLVRSARPNAVETVGQEAFVLSYRPRFGFHGLL